MEGVREIEYFLQKRDLRCKKCVLPFEPYKSIIQALQGMSTNESMENMMFAEHGIEDMHYSKELLEYMETHTMDESREELLIQEKELLKKWKQDHLSEYEKFVENRTTLRNLSKLDDESKKKAIKALEKKVEGYESCAKYDRSIHIREMSNPKFTIALLREVILKYPTVESCGFHFQNQTGKGVSIASFVDDVLAMVDPLITPTMHLWYGSESLDDIPTHEQLMKIHSFVVARAIPKRIPGFGEEMDFDYFVVNLHIGKYRIAWTYDTDSLNDDGELSETVLIIECPKPLKSIPGSFTRDEYIRRIFRCKNYHKHVDPETLYTGMLRFFLTETPDDGEKEVVPDAKRMKEVDDGEKEIVSDAKRVKNE